MFHLHLQSVFDKSYCAKLVELGYKNGFDRAGVNVHGETKMREDIRNNSRSIWNDAELAKELEARVKEVAGSKYPSLFSNQEEFGFGSLFRMYRYEPGEYFKPHKDGSVNKEESKSLITVLTYLNDTDGGETVLMPEGFSKKESWIKFKPKTGDVLLFQHDCWHSAEQVNSAEKYVLRTDIFYKKL
jgi:Rps23 Pro-64 3,4-dihydroxylase Tpa1-like proline 4-hydroxylase